jgi:hypothetical protein
VLLIVLSLDGDSVECHMRMLTDPKEMKKKIIAKSLICGNFDKDVVCIPLDNENPADGRSKNREK